LSLSWALHERGDVEGELAALQEILRLDPDRVVAHFNLGVLLLDRMGDCDGAAAAFREAARLDPTDAAGPGNLALALLKKGDLDGAIAAGKEAVRLDPTEQFYHAVLADSLRGRGDVDGAIAQYREVIRLRPEGHYAYMILGELLLGRKGEHEEAARMLEEAIRIQPASALAHSILSFALHRSGNVQGELAALRETLRLEPDQADALFRLGILLCDEIGDHDGAIASFTRAAELEPANVHALENIGTALLGKGELDAAIRQFESVLRDHADRPYAHLLLGIAQHSKGDLDRAISAYNDSIRIDPKNRDAYADLAFALRAKGRFREALENFRRAHELGSPDPTWKYPSARWIHDTERMLALEPRIPMQQGQPEPADAGERVLLARICAARGLHGKAASLWQSAIKDRSFATSLEESYAEFDLEPWYEAAREAVLAASIPPGNVGALEERERARWRAQALEWLRQDVVLWGKVVEQGGREARKQARGALQRLRLDHALASVRDQAGLTRLPASEREAWRTFWAQVNALLERAKAG